MKTSELNGKALNAAVAIAQGWFFDPDYSEGPLWVSSNGTAWIADSWMPSTNWEQGGAIIEQKKIGVKHFRNTSTWAAGVVCNDKFWSAESSNLLEAAMRTFVLSKLGDTVELPEGLKL